MNCKKCNKNNPTNSKSCIYCGNKLLPENEVENEHTSDSKSTSKDIDAKIGELNKTIELILNALYEQGIIKQPIDEPRIEVASETGHSAQKENISVTSDKGVTPDTPVNYTNCNSCGNQNEFISKFCTKCGSLLQKQPETVGDIDDTPIDDKPIDSEDFSEKVTLPIESKTSVRQSKSFRLDSILGRNWLSGIGIISIIIGVIFLTTISYVFFMIVPPILAIIFLILSELWKTKYPKFAQALGGGSVGILYAFSWLFWAEPIVPVIITLITSVLAAILALRHNSSYIAILGIIGAFLTPNILNIQKINFGIDIGVIIYLITVNISVIALATFKTWRWFTLLALIGTLATFYSWYNQIGVDLAIIQSQLSLTALFLIFVASTTLFHLIWKKASNAFDYVLMVINALGYLSLSYLIMYDSLTDWMGLFTLSVALIYLAISIISYFRIPRHNHLTLMSIGLTVTLITTAIAVQFGDQHHWRTVFWSVHAAVLMLLATKLSLKPFKLVSLIILALTVVSIIAGDSFEAFTIGYPDRLNPYLASYILTIVAFLATAYISHYLDKDEHKYPYEQYIPHVFFSAAILVSSIAVPVLTQDPWRAVTFSLISILLVITGWRLNLQFVRRVAFVPFSLSIIWVLAIDTPTALKLSLPDVLYPYLIVYLVVSVVAYASAYTSFKSIQIESLALTNNVFSQIIDNYTTKFFFTSANIVTAVATAVLLENPWISLGFAIKAALLVFLGEKFKIDNLRWLSIPSLILSVGWILFFDIQNASSLSITQALNTHLLPYILTLSSILITAYYIYQNRITNSISHRIMWPMYLYSGIMLSIIAPLVFDETAWHVSIIWAIQSMVLILASRKFGLIEFEISNLILIIVLAGKLLIIDSGINDVIELVTLGISIEKFTPILNYRILSFLVGILAIYFSAYITKKWSFENPLTIKVTDDEEWIIPKKYIVGSLIVIANLLTFWILNSEIIKTIDYFFGDITDLKNIKSLSLSLVWATYAIIIISVGIMTRLSKVRLTGMGLMFAPIIKLYVYDLWDLENVYRVSLFIILGLIFLISGFLYQKYSERIREFLSDDSDSQYNTTD